LFEHLAAFTPDWIGCKIGTDDLEAEKGLLGNGVLIIHVIVSSFPDFAAILSGAFRGSMTDFVGKQKAGMGPQKEQKSPFDSQSVVIELDQESRFSLFRFFFCPGHGVTG